MQTFCQSHNLNAIIAFLCYKMLSYSEKVMLYYLMVVKVNITVQTITREGFLRKNIVAVSFFQNCAIHQYS